MIIATWNVFNGTTEARVSELKTTCDADIMTFQETRFSEGPNTVWRGDPGKTNKGVSVWCQYDFQTVQPNVPVSPSIAIRIENSPLGKLNILNLWAKPNPDYSSDLMNSLKAYDDFIKSDPTIIMGDFNIDLLECNNHPNTENLLDFMLENMMMSQITKYNIGK